MRNTMNGKGFVSLDTSKKKVQLTYNTAADSFDDPANAYWERYGRRTVERLNLALGSHVLDVACGTGASALPAAEIVGAQGRVIGVDFSENLLALARHKAQRRGLDNIELQFGDMTQLGFADETFDAVVCVFGIFFVPDMEALVAELWRTVKPGGKLAVTTWGPDFFEPLYSAFDNVLSTERPDLVSNFRPWDRIITVEALEQLLVNGGASNVQAVAEEGRQMLNNPESWWKAVLGTGIRATVEAAGPDLAERVRQENLAFIQQNNIRSIATNVIYGIAQKEI
jgi:ubiquinone/menaquinone biosynthesis C-methylase UbiE